MRPKYVWLGVAAALLAVGLVSDGARAQTALTGVVSSSDEGATRWAYTTLRSSASERS